MNGQRVFNFTAIAVLYGFCVSIAFSIVAVEFFVGLLFILWMIKIYLADGGLITSSKLSVFLTILMILRVVSVAQSIDRPDSILTLGKLPLVLVMFPINSLFDRKTLERAVLVFLIAIGLSSVLGSFKVIFFDLDRARTTYGGYTGLSLQLVIAVNFGLYLLLKEPKRLNWIFAPLLAILFVGLFATFARTQWISALISCSLVFALLRPRMIYYWITAIIAGVLLMPQKVMLRVLDTFHFGGDSSRLALWRGSAGLLDELPLFGFGPRTFNEVFPAEAMCDLLDKSVWNYHNDFLQIAIESGWIAFAAIFALYVAVFVLLIRAIRAGDSLKITAGSALVGLFFSSLFNGVFFDPMVMPAIALLFAIIGKRDDFSPKSGDRILLVRLDKIGDVVLTTPMAGAIKSRFPGVRVDMAVRAIPAPVAAMSAHTDEIFVAPDSVFEFAKEIKRRKYSAVVSVHPEFGSALAPVLAGVPVRIGTEFRLWSPLLFTHRVLRHKNPLKHESVLNAELIEFMGIDPVKLPPPELIPPEDKNTAGSSGHAVGFHPGSGGSALRCPASILGEAARGLREEGYSIVLTGGPDDSEFVAEFLGHCGPVDLDLAGKTDLEDLVKNIARCEVFVAQGTGPLHIACGIGVPVVGIFPPSLRTGPRRWHPIGAAYKIVQPELPECKRCTGNRCRHFNCMSTIRPKTIIEAVKELSVV